jgi:S1-C subfamily serine protease
MVSCESVAGINTENRHELLMKHLLISLATVFVLLSLIPENDIRAEEKTDGLPETIARIKESVVGVGTYEKMRRPPAIVFATGFAVLDGKHVITNAHAIPEKLDKQHKEFLALFIGQGRDAVVLEATVAAIDENHDLCLLSFAGKTLPPMVLGDDSKVNEGEIYAFTGYPIGAVLGLYASTHRGMISAVTPIALPSNAIRPLDKKLASRLQSPYPIFQLDATAYPGNSGSPLYDINNGEVIGIINKVFVQGTKENAITDPSGITYAIPVQHVKKLLDDYLKERE